MRANKENILDYLKTIKPQLKNSGIKTLALFGSFSTNKQSVYSDIDIAISKEKDFLIHNSSYEYFDIISNIKSKIKKKFHRNVDVFNLDNNSAFKNSILKKLIYI